MSNKRFQECSMLEKLYRRIKYQPYYFAKACLYTMRAIVDNNFKSNKRYIYSLYFSVFYGEWSMKAKYYCTTEEVFKKFRIKGDSNESI